MSRKEIDEKAADPENGKKLWELSEGLVRTLSGPADADRLFTQQT
jgi:hypothetical protein